MKCLVFAAALTCLGAEAQASAAHDCVVLTRSSVRVRLTLTIDTMPVNENLIKTEVNRVWNAKGLKVEWVAANPAQRPWDGVDLWVDLRKNEINKAVDAAANQLAREYLIQPISARHLLLAERHGEVEDVLGGSIAEEIRKLVTSAQCEQGR
jgi:hypothetical protein